MVSAVKQPMMIHSQSNETFPDSHRSSVENGVCDPLRKLKPVQFPASTSTSHLANINSNSLVHFPNCSLSKLASPRFGWSAVTPNALNALCDVAMEVHRQHHCSKPKDKQQAPELPTHKRKLEGTESGYKDECSEDPASQPKKKQSRGHHVKDKPDMHQTARSGQEKWRTTYFPLVEDEWMSHKDLMEGFAEFTVQQATCHRLHKKMQSKTLLSLLQLALALEEICVEEFPFGQAEDESRSFLGWRGFRVKDPSKFEKRITNLFDGKPLTHQTVQAAFRRTLKLIPCKGQWRKAWQGTVPFVWNSNDISAASTASEVEKNAHSVMTSDEATTAQSREVGAEGLDNSQRCITTPHSDKGSNVGAGRASFLAVGCSRKEGADLRELPRLHVWTGVNPLQLFVT